jgi:hypothetical protein
LFTPITAEEFAQRMGLVDAPGGSVTTEGVAELIRTASQRWGPTPRSQLAAFARAQLERLDLEVGSRRTELINAALETLTALGELIPIELEPEPAREEVEGAAGDWDAAPPAPRARTPRRLAPCAPAVVRFREGGLLLGASPPPGMVAHREGEPGSLRRVARWLTAADAGRALAESDLDELSPDDWLSTEAVVAYAQRRVDEGDEEAGVGVAVDPAGQLWSLILRDLERFGSPIDQDHDISVLCRPPGGLFGSPRQRSGRWRGPNDSPNGTWLAWQSADRSRPKPLVVHVERHQIVRAMELYDDDEWRWALMSRGDASGAPEWPTSTEAEGGGCVIQWRCPPPSAYDRLAAICKVERWNWRSPRRVEVCSGGSLKA